MKKITLTLLLLIALMFALVVGCGTTDEEEPDQGEAPVEEGDADGDDSEDPYKVTVIVKATDSDYWQTLLAGAKAAESDSEGKVVVTTDGPPSETDIDRQVSILENVIATRPDAVVISSTSSDATVPAVEDAMSMGMPVITIDNRLNTDEYTSFLATDHRLAASMAAEAMAQNWEDMGIDPAGKKVIVISSVAGTTVNTERTEGLLRRLQNLFLRLLYSKLSMETMILQEH